MAWNFPSLGSVARSKYPNKDVSPQFPVPLLADLTAKASKPCLLVLPKTPASCCQVGGVGVHALAQRGARRYGLHVQRVLEEGIGAKAFNGVKVVFAQAQRPR